MYAGTAAHDQFEMLAFKISKSLEGITQLAVCTAVVQSISVRGESRYQARSCCRVSWKPSRGAETRRQVRIEPYVLLWSIFFQRR